MHRPNGAFRIALCVALVVTQTAPAWSAPPLRRSPSAPGGYSPTANVVAPRTAGYNQVVRPRSAPSQAQRSTPQRSNPQRSTAPRSTTQLHYLQPPGARTRVAQTSNFQAYTEKNWRFQFQNAPWPTVLRQFARANGMSLQIQTQPRGDFSYFDDRLYSITEAVDIFNDHLLPLGYLLVRNDTKLTMIASSGRIDDGVVPFVSLTQLKSLGRHELASVAVPVSAANPQALVTEMQNLMSGVGKVRALSNSKRLLLTDTGAYLRRAYDLLNGSGLAASEVQTVVYKLRNTKAESIAQAVNSRFASAQDGESGAANAQAPQVNFAVAEPETNTLLLRGSPEVVRRLQALICELDQPAAQVLISAMIVEVQLGDTREKGVEVGLQDSVLFNRSVIDNIVTITETVTSTTGVQTSNDRILSQTSAPGFQFNTPQMGNNTAINPGRVGTQGLGSLGVGRTNADLGFGGLVLSAGSNSVNVLIRALQAYYKIDILSRPTIRTVDNKEAFIQAGQQVPVVDGVSVTANGNANPVIRQDRSGIILKVVPKISPDGLVQLQVNAEKSAFQLTPGSGVPIFTDATNGNVIEAPVKDITTAETTIAARTGQTVVLGGLITRDKSVVERKVPLLGDIPIVKHAFRYDFEDTQRKELLIFLTPHIIANDATSDRHTESEVQRVHMDIPAAHKIYGSFLPQDRAMQHGGPIHEGEPLPEEIVPNEEISPPLSHGDRGMPSLAPHGAAAPTASPSLAPPTPVTPPAPTAQPTPYALPPQPASTPTPTPTPYAPASTYSPPTYAPSAPTGTVETMGTTPPTSTAPTQPAPTPSLSRSLPNSSGGVYNSAAPTTAATNPSLSAPPAYRPSVSPSLNSGISPSVSAGVSPSPEAITAPGTTQRPTQPLFAAPPPPPVGDGAAWVTTRNPNAPAPTPVRTPTMQTPLATPNSGLPSAAPSVPSPQPGTEMPAQQFTPSLLTR